MENTLYIIDSSVPYTGSVMNTMNKITGLVHYYDNMTFEEYNKTGNLVALTWEELKPLHENYLKSLQEPFKLVTYDFWEEQLNCLPPCNWHKVGDWEVFYISEAYTDDLHSWYFRNFSTNICLQGLRSKYMTDAEILTELETFSKSQI